MHVEVVQQRENALLDRLEVRFKVLHPKGKTPTRGSVREALASQLKVDPNLVIVDHIHPQFGKGEAAGYAKIYTDREKADAIERGYTSKRNPQIGKATEKKASEKGGGAEPKKAGAVGGPTGEEAEETAEEGAPKSVEETGK